MTLETERLAHSMVEEFARSRIERRIKEQEEKDDEKKRKVFYTFVLGGIFLSLLILFLSIGTFTVHVGIANPKDFPNITHSKMLNSYCNEICFSEGAFSKKSIIDYTHKDCICNKISFLARLNNKRNAAWPSQISVINENKDNYQIDYSRLNGCKTDALREEDQPLPKDFSWNKPYLVISRCKEANNYYYIHARRSDFSLNEPPKIIASTKIERMKEGYSKKYNIMLSSDEIMNVTIDAGRTNDPDGFLTSIEFNTTISKYFVYGNKINVLLDGSEFGAKDVDIFATDNKGDVSTESVTLIVTAWEIGREKTGYLFFAGSIIMIFTLIGFEYLNKYFALRKIMKKILEAYEALVWATFFGIMLNGFVIIFVFRLVTQPVELSRIVTADSFLPSFDPANNSSMLLLKTVAVAFLMIVLYLIIRKSGTNVKDILARMINWSSENKVISTIMFVSLLLLILIWIITKI
jgi:hypothetical protein